MTNPKTCANAAVSDRNGYMIELVGIYNHFGQKPNEKELPDYLPLMVDFLSMTTESRDDPIRDKLIKEYFFAVPDSDAVPVGRVKNTISLPS